MEQFSGYIHLGEMNFREDFGLYFEEFQAGQKFKHRPGLTISQQDNKEEALDTLNNAQLHYDAHYARFTEWKFCLGVSTMTLQKILGMTSKTFGKKERIMSFDSIVMRNPVFDGKTLYAESEILKKKQNTLSVKTKGLDESKNEVLNVIYEIQFEEKNKSQKRSTEQRFRSHRKCTKGFFVEQYGLFFEDFLIGECFEHRPGKYFTAEENRLHALRSLNFQYSFQDEKSRIEETFLLGSLTALTTRTFGKVVANLAWEKIKLYHAAYPGDWIFAKSKILDKRSSNSRPDQGIVYVLTEGFNQEGKLLCSFERCFLIYKKGMGPYDKAGY